MGDLRDKVVHSYEHGVMKVDKCKPHSMSCLRLHDAESAPPSVSLTSVPIVDLRHSYSRTPRLRLGTRWRSTNNQISFGRTADPRA